VYRRTKMDRRHVRQPRHPGYDQVWGMPLGVPMLLLEGRRRLLAGGISARMVGAFRLAGLRAVRMLVPQLPRRERILRTWALAFWSLEAVHLLGKFGMD
jgi:hypothetical protein